MIFLYILNARVKTKNLLSRTPRFSKNMRRKQILIGLFALIINRTIGEPKSLQGGTERAFVTMCFFLAVTDGTGISGVVFARAAQAPMG